MYKQYPKLYEAMEKRHDVYNAQSEYIKFREREGAVLVIRPPSKLKIGRIERNPDKLMDAYKIGCDVCEKRISEIKKFLKMKLYNLL